MKMQLLYEFMQLANLLNFSQAAQKMNVTQPVLSRHMKMLEDKLGVVLFIRSTHKVALTSAGKLFLEEARKIVQQYEGSLAIINAFAGKGYRQLKIVVLGEAIQDFLTPFLTQFQQDYADITIECRDNELDEALRFLEEHACDLGFVIRPNFLENNRFCALPFLTDPLCVAVNRHHPLAKRGKVSLREVSEWPIIRVDHRESPLFEQFSTRFFDHYNIAYRLDKEYPNLKTCCFNLEYRKDVALLMPKHRQYLLGDNSVLLEVIEDDYWFNLELVWDNQNTNTDINIFLTEFRKFLDANHG